MRSGASGDNGGGSLAEAVEMTGLFFPSGPVVHVRESRGVAGADAEQTAALDTYGKCVGLAFQVTDDLLDVRSSEAAAGKRVGKDSAKGKLTFPRLLGVDASAAYASQLVLEACKALGPLGPP